MRRRQDAIFAPAPAAVPGVDLREAEQLELLAELGELAADQPWGDEPRRGLRYRFENPNFQHGEALTLYAMLKRLRPGRVVEVGSGWSSAAMLDTNDRALGRSARFTFVEPYPELLHELTRGDDLDIRATGVQDVEDSLWDELGEGDVLFIDSSHVAKVGSDVNHLLLDVLPRLAPGVVVHVHDVYYPFEYPRAWVLEGRAWNEAYLLRAFLAFNAAFRIELFLSFLAERHAAELAARLPLAPRSPGSSLWLRRTA